MLYVVKKMLQNVDNIIVSRQEFLDCLLDIKNNLHVEILNLSRVLPDWKLINRILPFHYLSLVTDSLNHAETDGFTKDIGPNAFLWINPGIAHNMHPTVPACPHQFYHLQFALTRDNFLVTCNQPLLFLPDASDLLDPFNALIDAFQQHGAYSEILLRTRLAVLICEIFRLADCPQESRRILTRNQRKIINNLLHTIAPEKLSAQMLAKKNQLNPDYFSRIFKNTYGCSPRSWLMRERMRRAALLLTESSLSVSEIAATIGYDDVYAFSKIFKKYKGKSPRNYRNNFLI